MVEIHLYILVTYVSEHFNRFDKFVSIVWSEGFCEVEWTSQLNVQDIYEDPALL